MALITRAAYAQQNLFAASQIISPEVHNDNTVSFRLLAPDAKVVKISGEWMPVRGFASISVALIKLPET